MNTIKFALVVILTLNKPKKGVATDKVLFRSHKNILKINTTINITIVSTSREKRQSLYGSARGSFINA